MSECKLQSVVRLIKLIESYDVMYETNGCSCDAEGEGMCMVCELGNLINSISESIDNALRLSLRPSSQSQCYLQVANGGHKMKKRTLREWNQRGRMVIKGSKSCGRNEFNEPVFRKDQTKHSNFTLYSPSCYEGSANYNQGFYFWGGDNPDPMDYDFGLCGQE